MRLTSISFERYKCFSEKQDFILKPLTIVFGRNGSGKSATLNAVPLLLYLLSQDEVGFDISQLEPQAPGEFGDLIHRYMKTGTLGMGGTFEDKDQSLRLWIEVQNFPREGKTAAQLVSKFKAYRNDELLLSLHWVLDQNAIDFDQGQALYNIKTRQSSEFQMILTFNGAWPDVAQQKNQDNANLISEFNEILDGLRQWRSGIRGMYQSLTYLESIRSLPEEIVKKQSPPPKGVGRTGENASLYFLNHQVGCGQRVKAWFEREDVGGWHLEIKDFGPAFSLQGNKGNLEAPINKIGRGLGQVFPIVVLRSMAPHSPRIEIVEEPESHLHPAAHGALADLFIEGAVAQNGPLIVETHSEIFLIRARRRVAEGKLNPDDIVIYWVDDEEEFSLLQPIHLNAQGELSDWPESVFSEDYYELLALQQAESQVNSEP